MKIRKVQGLAARFAFLLMWVGGVLVPSAGWTAQRPEVTGGESAEVFFTTLADRLLRQQFEFGVTNIPVAPTNAYSPAVHRLLQVSANIWECAQTNRFPSVFRPLFTSNASGVVICGFTNDNRRSTLTSYLATQNTFGIPLVIAAKKGLPNFNEYTLLTDTLVARKLEVRKSAPNSPPPWETNQMYLLSITNLFGVEGWNSYASPYTNGILTLEVTNTAVIKITNQAGLAFHTNFNFSRTTNIPPGAWSGKQFILPLSQQMAALPFSAYLFNSKRFVTTRQSFEHGLGFPIPEWFLTISNRLIYILSDGNNIVDYTALQHIPAARSLSQELFDVPSFPPPDPNYIAEMWDTNRFSDTNEMMPTYGIWTQLEVSRWMYSVPPSVWRDYCLGYVTGQEQACAAFDSFLTPSASTTNLAMQAPFSPMRRMAQTITWQANDPLVHYHQADWRRPDTSEFIPPTISMDSMKLLGTLGRTNQCYSPWNSQYDYDPTSFDLTLKDPGVTDSDHWDFPEGQPLDLSWLGRVHRGTPWQTVYLKSPAASSSAWSYVSPDPLAHPTNDWFLARLMATLLNPHPPTALTSINDLRPDSWAGVWNGVQVLSNNLPSEALSPSQPPQFDSLVMTLDSPQAAALTEAVSRTRSAQPENRFSSLADFLAVPELTVASPWLNLSDPNQLYYGMTDAAFEAIPSQILARLREDDILGNITHCDNSLVLQFTGWPDYTYELQVSTNLQSWDLLASPLYLTNGWVELTMPPDGSPVPRFYRLKLLP